MAPPQPRSNLAVLPQQRFRPHQTVSPLPTRFPQKPLPTISPDLVPHHGRVVATHHIAPRPTSYYLWSAW